MTLTQIMLWIEQNIECSIIWFLIEFISNFFGIDISGGMAIISLHFWEPVLKVQLKGFSWGGNKIMDYDLASYSQSFPGLIYQ